MASDSGQKFIKRNRPPRVQISYEDPGDAEKIVELPFVMGVMADLSGNASPVEKPSMSERKFSDVDMDNIDAYMASIKPAISMKVDNKLGEDAGNEKLGINLTFSKMADFEPAAVVRQIPALNALLEAREQLANLQRYMDGKVAAEDKLKELLSNPEMMRAMSEHRAAKQNADAENPSEDADKTD
ncbi:type VI secretion system contractile sheath small subunit [Hoeflea ulvae]|uniref:Type VI secretion system contractile sheath small subunit n=1 Tax=Hoeflea ulvae TaxID=2983764 RepID=A0ABT3YH15_9HYPH|nr:type VI secretion system contractile sheath small subunit [Hoeflea ulvae]MCY0095191.1 type VI secretion system contractile sheath small subunit [Hoeflea ulvae]